MKREQVAGALLLLAAAKPVWILAKKLKAAWDLSHLPIIVLRGSNGLEVHVSPLGCLIQRLLVPNQYGEVEDVVLGFSDLKPYVVSTSEAGPGDDAPGKAGTATSAVHWQIKPCQNHGKLQAATIWPARVQSSLSSNSDCIATSLLSHCTPESLLS